MGAGIYPSIPNGSSVRLCLGRGQGVVVDSRRPGWSAYVYVSVHPYGSLCAKPCVYWWSGQQFGCSAEFLNVKPCPHTYTHMHTCSQTHTGQCVCCPLSPLPVLLQVLWAPLGCHPSLSHTGPIIGLHTALLLPARRWECPAGRLLFLQSGQWPPTPSPKHTSCSLSHFLIVVVVQYSYI